MTKITNSARGELCTLRIPGVCNFDTATTVFAHTGSGTAKRLTDKGCYACSDCHDAIDFRTRVFLHDQPETQARLHASRARYILDAEARTAARLQQKGLAA